MSKVLCVENVKNLATLITSPNGSNDFINTCLLKREVCETLANGTVQVIPYVTFFSFDVKTSKLSILRYTRPSTNNEERLKDKESIGIGGHVEGDLTYTNTAPVSPEMLELGSDEGDLVYQMTMEDLNTTLVKAAEREIKEELGVDVDLFNKGFKYPRFFFQANGGVNDVHVGYSLLYSMTELELLKFMDSIIQKDDEVVNVNLFTVNLADNYMDYSNKLVGDDLKYFYTKVTISEKYEGYKKYLANSHNFEDWSLIIIEFLLNITAARVWSCVSYNDIVDLVAAEEYKFI